MFMSQSRYMEAMACLDTDNDKPNDWSIWASYKLGIYSSVLQYEWDGRNIKVGIAKAVSLATYGQTEEAELILNQLTKLGGLNKHKLCLSMALAPFMPTYALSLLRELKQPPTLFLISLLIRNSLNLEAEYQIKRFFKQNKAVLTSKNSEIYLLYSNFYASSPDEQLRNFNLFLESNNLPTVTLSNPNFPFNVLNLDYIQPISLITGPLITILMTAHNTADRLSPAVESLLKQTYKNIEIIIINDASDDETDKVIIELMKKDKRIRYIALAENVGTFAAKTIGFQQAQGEFVMCHDSDDWSHPLRLELQIKPLLSDKSIVATTSNWVRLQDDGVFYTRSVYPLSRFNPSSVLFRKKLVVEKAGLWDLVRTGADSEFNARIEWVFGSNAIRRIKLPLALGAHRKNSLMTSSLTGHTENGVSIIRQTYWELWSNWHLQMLKSGIKPYLPKLSSQMFRPFTVPVELEVSEDSLQTVLNVLISKAECNKFVDYI